MLTAHVGRECVSSVELGNDPCKLKLNLSVLGFLMYLCIFLFHDFFFGGGKAGRGRGADNVWDRTLGPK